MAHGEPPGTKQVQDLVRQDQETEIIGHGGPILAEAFGDLVRRKVKGILVIFVGLGPIDTIEVFALDIFHQRDFQHLLVGGLANDGGDGLKVQLSGRGQAALSATSSYRSPLGRTTIG